MTNTETLRALVDAGNRLDSAMDMQEQRERGTFHLSQQAAAGVWKDARRLWAEAVEQAISAGDGVAEGFVVVPRELTDDMEMAFLEAWFSKTRPIDDPQMQDAYEAMLAAAPAAQVVEPIAKALAIVDKVAMFNGGFVADDLRKVEATLNACAAALRSYSKDKWGPVANYSDNYWYIAGEPWRAADALLQGHSAPEVVVDEAMELRLCETKFLALQPDRLYRFTVDENCPQCVAAAAPYRERDALNAALGREGGGNG